MKVDRSLAAAFAAVAAASFAGCGGGAPNPAPPVYSGGAVAGANLRPAVNPLWVTRALAGDIRPAGRGSSYLLPNAKNSSLLYISVLSMGTSVNIYGMPAWNALGELLGFSTPYSLCVDGAQNVYVTDFGTKLVSEYAHGSVRPIRRLTDHQGTPISCAVDAKTGNLAVANNTGPNYGDGNVIVYKAAKGTPTAYAAANMHDYYFVAYDAAGNIFVDGLDDSGNVLLAELPSGKSAFKAIAMNQTISVPGDVAWDGQFLAVGDQLTSVIYQFKVSGSTAIAQGSTTLDGAISIFGFFFTGATPKHPQATAVLGADFGSDAASRWDYPAGGTPVKTISFSGPAFGIAVSK